MVGLSYRGIVYLADIRNGGIGIVNYKRWNLPINRRSFENDGSAAADIVVTIQANDPNWTWVIPQLETDFNDAFKNSNSSDENTEYSENTIY